MRANETEISAALSALWLREDFVLHKSQISKLKSNCTSSCSHRIIVVQHLAQRSKSGTCYSAAYMSQTCDQKRFTISEVTADWHELMIPQRTMRPSIARASEQLDPRCS